MRCGALLVITGPLGSTVPGLGVVFASVAGAAGFSGNIRVKSDSMADSPKVKARPAIKLVLSPVRVDSRFNRGFISSLRRSAVKVRFNDSRVMVLFSLLVAMKRVCRGSWLGFSVVLSVGKPLGLILGFSRTLRTHKNPYLFAVGNCSQEPLVTPP